MSKTIRIGGGSGFQGGRIRPAVILAAQDKLDYLALECLAERTIALDPHGKSLSFALLGMEIGA